MRISIALFGALALASCSQQAEEPVTDDVAVEAPLSTFDGGPVAGYYESTSNEGVVINQDLTDDGAFTNTQDGETIATGTYEVSEGHRICFTNSDTSATACYLPSDLAADGSWTATREGDDSETWTVRRVQQDNTQI